MNAVRALKQSSFDDCGPALLTRAHDHALNFDQMQIVPALIPRPSNSFRLSADVWQIIYMFLPLSSWPFARRVCSCSYGSLANLTAKNKVLSQTFEQYLLGVADPSAYRKRVWVAVREKPSQPGVSSCVKSDHKCVTFRNQKSRERFFFDAAFDGSSTQLEIWSRLQQPLLSSIMQRKNVCLMAYGQTGSGKTHTMFGDLDGNGQEGAAFRAVRGVSHVLRSQDAEDGAVPSVEFSFLEVYNEDAYDLLSEQTKLHLSIERKIKREGSKYHAAEYSGQEHVVARGLTRRKCDIGMMSEQISAWLQEGAATRTVGKTVCNERSSRSHAVATLHICWDGDAASEVRLYLVDLAGSERAGQHALSAQQLKQGVNINKSLSTMARVVSTLASGAAEHVPYRDSTLTWLLSDAITGVEARAFMIATLHPDHPAETLSTLQYARQYSSLKSNQEEINKFGSHVRRALAVVQDRRRCKQLWKEAEETRATISAKRDNLRRGQNVKHQLREFIAQLEALEEAEEVLARRRAALAAAEENEKEKQARYQEMD